MDEREELRAELRAMAEKLRRLGEQEREFAEQVEFALAILRKAGVPDPAYETEVFVHQWVGEVPPSYEVFLQGRE